MRDNPEDKVVNKTCIYKPYTVGQKCLLCTMLPKLKFTPCILLKALKHICSQNNVTKQMANGLKCYFMLLFVEPRSVNYTYFQQC